MSRILILMFLVLCLLGAVSGKLFVALAALGMIFLIRHADKVFAKQDAPSPLRPNTVQCTITALDRKETEASQSFN
jgi:hypothetical protein